MYNDNRNYYRNQFEGDIRPKRIPTAQTPDAYKADLEFAISDDKRYRSICLVRVKPPTFQFPKPAVFLQIYNGHDRIFTKIHNIDDLRLLGNFLIASAEKVEQVVASCALDESKLQQLNAVAQMLNQMPKDEE